MGKKIKICKEAGCHNAQSTDGYCRLHYLRNWKKIKDKKKELAAKKLNRYVEYVCNKYPHKYMEIIKSDINSPDFERYMEEGFGNSPSDSLFGGATDQEEVEQLIHNLKIEDKF